MKPLEIAKLLKELGMETLSKRLMRKATGKEKLLVAVENHRYATREDIEAFKSEIREYDKEFVLTELKEYKHLPPNHVLKSLKEAKKRKCFDKFCVGHIRKVKDPILFGQIDGFAELYFFIDQWGEDVKIEDILKYE